MDDDTEYWTYSLYRKDCYVIEAPNGDLLIGDQLPKTEAEARLLCRCANRARSQALRMERERVMRIINGFS